MALSPGTRFGAFEILSPLGAGGMGEVYRARDSRLNRDVALKVLPEAFTSDPERLARFSREAQVLAALNHSNTTIQGAPGLRMMAVTLTGTSSSLSPGVPRKLFDGRYGSTSPARGYDVTSDGRRFLMIRNVDPPPRPPSALILVTNFGQELTRSAPHSQN